MNFSSQSWEREVVGLPFPAPTPVSPGGIAFTEWRIENGTTRIGD